MAPNEGKPAVENLYTVDAITADVSAELGAGFVEEHAVLVRDEIDATLLVYAEFGAENLQKTHRNHAGRLEQYGRRERAALVVNEDEAQRLDAKSRVAHAVYRSFMRRFEASQNEAPPQLAA